MSKILDTNVLLDYPQIVTKNNEDYIISTAVLKEIDGLKLNGNPVTAQKARKAAVYISKNMDNISWDTTKRTDSVDDLLLQITYERDGTLITNDVALKVRAKVAGVNTEGYSWKEDYTGVTYLSELVANEDDYNYVLSELYSNRKYDFPNYKFSNNEYLIAPSLSQNGETAFFRFNDGEFITVIPRSFKNDWVGEIYPANNEQVCLIDAILNSDNGIIYAGGKFGTGY